MGVHLNLGQTSHETNSTICKLIDYKVKNYNSKVNSVLNKKIMRGGIILKS